MPDLTNSHSLTDFQRNACAYIDNMNEDQKPLLLTVGGQVRAVMVDPKTFQAMEEAAERERFLAAIQEGEADIQAGRNHPAAAALAALRIKHGLSG